VPTRRTETIELRLLDLDGEEGVYLRRDESVSSAR